MVRLNYVKVKIVHYNLSPTNELLYSLCLCGEDKDGYGVQLELATDSNKANLLPLANHFESLIDLMKDSYGVENNV